jgi:hypothetical protein
MTDETNTLLNQTTQVLLKRIKKDDCSSIEAQQFAQAVQSLTQAYALLQEYATHAGSNT